MSKPTLTLYNYRRCPFAIRVRMALHIKEIPFATIEENLSDLSDELKKLHPEAKVPLLVDSTDPEHPRAIYDSVIITQYLDEAFPDTRALMPGDPWGNAQVRMWTQWCNALFKPEIDRFKYGPSRLGADEITLAIDLLAQYLNKLDETLSDGRKWLLGDELTLADVHVFPFYRQLARCNPGYPGLNEESLSYQWYERIMALPAYERALKKPEA